MLLFIISSLRHRSGDFPCVWRRLSLTSTIFDLNSLMKVAILGGGQLGRALQKQNPDWVVFRGYNILRPASVRLYCHHNLSEFDVIINTIAQTDTRQCEIDSIQYSTDSFRINSVFPQALSRFCNSTRKKFVHISTGCVYREFTPDGEISLCREEDCVDPLTTYALQKYYAEKSLQPNDLIIRGRLFFGEEESNSNLITKLKKFKTFSTVKNSMSSVHTISDVLPKLIHSDAKGIYNVVNSSAMSLYELANLVGLSGEPYDPKPGEYRAPNLQLSFFKLLKMGITTPRLEDEFVRCWNNYKSL